MTLVHSSHHIVEGAQTAGAAAEVVRPAAIHGPSFRGGSDRDKERRHRAAKRAENLPLLDLQILHSCPGVEMLAPCLRRKQGV